MNRFKKILTLFVLSFASFAYAEQTNSKKTADDELINPKKLSFKNYMTSDKEHKKHENSVENITVETLKKAKKTDVIALLSPLMRLDDESVIKSLLKNKKVESDGTFTTAHLSLLSGKDHLEGFSDHEKAFLLDHVYFDESKDVYVAVFRLPGKKHINNLIKIKLLDIEVKNAEDGVGEFLSDLIQKEDDEKTDTDTPEKKEDKRIEHQESIFDKKIVVKKEPSIFDRKTVITEEPSVFGKKGSDIIVIR
ncbi:MAG: hypothetical protein KBD31_00580 [Proteobacteria bacterium]|nr:hypothetical protein [Pseudomonadota bacterium]